MPESDRPAVPQLKDEVNRTLRSSSPAVKRPASDMGAQEREDHNADVAMAETSTTDRPDTQTKPEGGPRPQKAGKRQRSSELGDTVPHMSDPRYAAQTAPLKEDGNTTTDAEHTLDSKVSTATDPVSNGPAAKKTLPSIDEQVQTVSQLLERQLRDKQKGYVVSGRWLRRVQARSSMPPQGSVEKSATEGDIGTIDNSDIALVGEDSGYLKDDAGELFTFLRPGLSIGEDLQVLPEEAWNLVTRWYGIAQSSPVITRYAHLVSEDDPSAVQWELYPPVFSLLKVPAGHTAQHERERDLTPPRMVSSRQTSYMKWLKEAKDVLKIDLKTKVRVWRIISGIKNSPGSDTLTPDLSRSSSPAPGTEIVANSGDKMILSANTFVGLRKGEQRELVEKTDETANDKYNGNVDLQTLGLSKSSEVVVLEEKGTKADEWATDNVKLSIKGAKPKGSVLSGRSSPTPSIMTRGRAQRQGKPQGIVGLTNLGNTCYMNSALQCIRSVEELTQYFLSGYYKKELNVDNPLGHQGQVARAYGDFLAQVHATSSSFAPTGLKRIIGKYGPSFAGYGQQDSQELLLFLLDGLQEDLNRIVKKPYIEKPDSTDEMVQDEAALKAFADRNWEDYKARNDSVITDLFAGMYKSTLTCPVCDKVSIIFDPFSNLTLQLPIENNWSKEIYYFPLQKQPVKIDVDIDKNSTIKDMKRFVAQRTHYDVARMICAESYKNKFFRIFDNNDVISESQITANDVICIYELDDVPTNYNPDKQKKFSIYSYGNKNDNEKVDVDSPAADRLIVPVHHRVVKVNGLNRVSRTFFGHPSFVVLTRADRQSYDLLLKKVLANVVGMSTRNILEGDVDTGTSDATAEDSDTLVVTDDGSSSESNNAQAKSVQGEDGLVDVSMREASQASESGLSGKEQATRSVLRPGVPVPRKLQQLFDIRADPTQEGIPCGWNSINENNDYESVKARAAKIARSLPHRPVAKSAMDESDTSDDAVEDIPHDEQRTSASDYGSDSGASAPQNSDNESSILPEASEIFSGKDSRGASKHQKKKTYSRKGRNGGGKPPRRIPPPPPPQPRPQTALHQGLVLPGDALILDWSPEAHDALFGGGDVREGGLRGTLTHRDIELLHDEELAARRAQRTSRKKLGVSLHDCLEEFGKTETLSEQNAWYCPRCKEHRRAEKQFELWKVPDILVMHFKRFSSNRNFRDKLEIKVDYPLEGLDMSSMVRDKSDGKSLTYDLFAVDNHYGGLGGGHYTAYAKHPVTGHWYDYNDSHVSQKEPGSVVTAAAYLLFYRRRDEGHLGGPALESILDQADAGDAAGSRDASPSGEGRRLDDSSHNGSSSASQVVRAHRVGDGGSALRTPVLTRRGLTPDPEDENLSRPHEIEFDEPPPYEEKMAVDEDEGVGMGPSLPWNDTPSWNWRNNAQSSAMAVPPSSNVDDEEMSGAGSRRPSNVSVNLSSTGVVGGSPPGSLDLDDQDMTDLRFSSDNDKDDVGRRARESAPPPGVAVSRVPFTNDDEDDDLPVVEIKVPDGRDVAGTGGG